MATPVKQKLKNSTTAGIKQKNPPAKDLRSIHAGFVNEDVMKGLLIIFILLIIGAASYATYRFVELSYKSITEYAGIAVVWVGVLAFTFGIIFGILRNSKVFFNLTAELYHYRPGIYYSLLFTGAVFFAAMTLLLYTNVTSSEPLDVNFERHCPAGTDYGEKYKSPEEFS